MLITEVRIKLAGRGSEGQANLLAFASITIDDAVAIRDLKVIESRDNGLFVAMPSRKLTDRCPCCGTKNHLEGRYCQHCGLALPGDRADRDEDGRSKLNADVAHPINPAARKLVQDAVLDAYREELARSLLPGYAPAWESGSSLPAAAGPLSGRLRAGAVA